MTLLSCQTSTQMLMCNCTPSLQWAKRRMWRYEDLLHKVGHHRNNFGLQPVKVSYIQIGWWTNDLKKKKKIMTCSFISNVNQFPRKRSRDQWRITIPHLVAINICQHFTVEEMDSHRLSSWFCQYVNLKDNIQPAGPAWPRMTRGIRQLKINGGRIWSMLAYLDKSSLFFSSRVDFGSRLVLPPPPNSFPE